VWPEGEGGLTHTPPVGQSKRAGYNDAKFEGWVKFHGSTLIRALGHIVITVCVWSGTTHLELDGAAGLQVDPHERLGVRCGADLCTHAYAHPHAQAHTRTHTHTHKCPNQEISARAGGPDARPQRRQLRRRWCVSTLPPHSVVPWQGDRATCMSPGRGRPTRPLTMCFL
jgi:hypothetical protein